MGTQDAFALLAGSLVGFSLGLIGGGGSVLAVPLLLYLVGVTDPHVAIGTSSLAVAVTAFVNLLPHARAGHVRWRIALTFALVGIVGATLGSSLSKGIEGRKLLLLFGLLMIVVAALMQRRGRAAAIHQQRHSGVALANVAGAGFAVGSLSGFFGIGGGFLIVPGLVLATGMPIIDAIGSSLIAVGAFGMTTAVNYALSGFVAWKIALESVAGGIAGGWVGARLAMSLSRERMLLHRVFGIVLLSVALYMLIRSVTRV